MEERCKERLFKNWHSYQCSRKAVEDGFCSQHHPRSKKARSDKSMAEYNKKTAEYVYKEYAYHYCKKLGLTVEQLKAGLPQ